MLPFCAVDRSLLIVIYILAFKIINILLGGRVGRVVDRSKLQIFIRRGGLACRDVHVGRHGSVLAKRDLHLGRHRSAAAIRDSHLGCRTSVSVNGHLHFRYFNSWIGSS